ncbi:FecR family protein [Pedobacter sp. PWIIR3]
MSSSKPEELIKKYLNNTCTPEERALLESWYNQQAGDAQNPAGAPDYSEIETDVWAQLKSSTVPPKRINWPAMTAAAVLIVVCSVFYYTNRISTDSAIHKAAELSAARILPGSNKAELVLEDGSVVPLVDTTSGMLTKQGGVAITKLSGGGLSYDASHSKPEAVVRFNTLRTPKGGQYQVDLPDGTRAWLNAASSLTYPTAFNGTERKVEVSGEVYFEVAVDKHKPFKVESAGQTIVVLGTHFNVTAYPDEQLTRTSLLEGSVKVIGAKKTVVIVPGQETVLNHSSKEISLRNFDADDVLAWRQGYFQFNNEDIRSIMRKLSRWYDLDVTYTKNFVDQRFSGSVSRFEEASKVLRMLEFTGTVHFNTNGRRVTVMP